MRLLPLSLAAFLLAPGVAAADPALDEEEVEFVRLINEYRARNGLDCLSISPTLNAAADYLSRAMGEQGFFSHDEPDGRDPFERMEDFGHTGWRTAGENIAWGTAMDKASEAFEVWRNSPGHNENMLRPGFKAMGIARVQVDRGWYWTNDFSDLVDGELHCSDGLPPVGYGDPDVEWNGSRGGSRGEEVDALETEGGCSAGGGLSLLGLAAALGILRRRDQRGR